MAGLFAQVHAILSNTVPEERFLTTEELLETLGRLQAGFAADYDRFAAAQALVFGPGIENFGVGATALFSEWERQGSGPALTAMIALAIEKFALDPADPCVKAAFLSAVLAEFPNTLLYHGNEHYRKVLLHCLRLISTHNGLFAGTNRAFDQEQIAQLLIASCIHDLGHAGGDNMREGVYTPGQMELYALNIVRPYLRAAGLTDDQIGDIETIVFCTDITFFAGDNSPCIRMKKIYKHYFWDDHREDVSMMMMGKLRRYEDRPRLVLMAMILHEADIATSAGLSYEQTVKETISIMEERGLKTAGPRTVIAFLREQLGETMFTEASKQIYGRVMSEVIHHAEQDIERGRKTFYES